MDGGNCFTLAARSAEAKKSLKADKNVSRRQFSLPWCVDQNVALEEGGFCDEGLNKHSSEP